MKHNYLNYDQAHKYVDNFAGKSAAKDVFWEGWDVIVWKRSPGAYMVKNGMYRNGQWGTARRIKPNERGAWRLPETP